MMFRTASGQKVAHEAQHSVWTHNKTTDGFSDIGAEDLVGCGSTRRDRSSSAVRHNRGCNVNQMNGSKVLMHLKNAVCTIKLWVKGEKHVKNMHPMVEELGTLSGEQPASEAVRPRLDPLVAGTIPCGTSCRGIP